MVTNHSPRLATGVKPMTTLLLRLAGPMQAWGVQSRFGVRDTGREPSKSGLVGLLGSALGRPRHADFSDLAQLNMAVRVDQEGTLQRDYHTAGADGYYRASGGVERKNAILSTRYYLADAIFLVGLEGEPALLHTIAHALQHPVWPLFLGRKAFPPSQPLCLADGLQEKPLREAIQAYPWLGQNQHTYRDLKRVRLVYDDPEGIDTRPDYPLSFVQKERHFLPRRLTTKLISKPHWPDQPQEEQP